jgi:hypothetical protein
VREPHCQGCQSGDLVGIQIALFDVAIGHDS